MAYNREFTNQLLQRLENNQTHKQYKSETYFYNIIATGNLEEIKAIIANAKDVEEYENIDYGKLSEDPLQNAKYHVAISTALVTRYCINQGLDPEIAYTMSDVYIQKMDKMTTRKDVTTLHSNMLLDFTKHMA